MESNPIDRQPDQRMTLARMPAPAKALATCIIAVLAVGLLGALGQIVVHDTIPTFYAQSKPEHSSTFPFGRSGRCGSRPGNIHWAVDSV